MCDTCPVSALLKLSKEHKNEGGGGVLQGTRASKIVHLIKQADQGNIREIKQYDANKKKRKTSKKHLILALNTHKYVCHIQSSDSCAEAVIRKQPVVSAAAKQPKPLTFLLSSRQIY